MILKSHVFEGVFKPIPKTDEFELEISLTKSSLKIRGFSKKLLIENQTELSGEHAIYILEGPINCYVGQSKDVKSRINNHKDKNKSDFNRCFILSSLNKDADLRGFLDYMESYAIQQMSSLGYSLENTKRPNPKEDILSNYKKDIANDWIDEFLSFLPILGFKKSPKLEKIKEAILVEEKIPKSADSKIISLKYNGQVMNGLDNREIFLNFIKKIGVSIVEKNCSSIFGTAFRVTKVYNKPKYGSCYEVEEDNEKFYIYFNISKADLIKKIIKIKEILNLDVSIFN